MYLKLKDAWNTYLDKDTVGVVIAYDAKIVDPQNKFIGVKYQITLIYKDHDITTHLEYSDEKTRNKDFKLLTGKP